MYFRNKIKGYAEAPLTHNMVMDVLGEYNRPNDKISELIKSGKLLALRRGLYVPGAELDLSTPNLFLIANHLRGPSYISLESALAHWEMIPERVHEVSSVTLKTKKKYDTPIGRFSYQYLDSPYYSFGLMSVKVGSMQRAIIASPEKAICDKIILTSGILLRSISQARDFLLEDMRMDKNQLLTLDLRAIHSWVEDAPKKSSLRILIKTLEEL